MRELLSDNEDVKELMDRTLSANSLLWRASRVSCVNNSDCTLDNKDCKFAVFDWREVILLEFPLILICRALVVSVCERTSAICDCKLDIFELCVRLKPLLVVMLSQLFDPKTSATVVRVWSAKA